MLIGANGQLFRGDALCSRGSLSAFRQLSATRMTGVRQKLPTFMMCSTNALHSTTESTLISRTPPETHRTMSHKGLSGEDRWVPRTVVIGGGIGGLMAAQMASKSSREVVILEGDSTDLALQSLESAKNKVLVHPFPNAFVVI